MEIIITSKAYTGIEEAIVLSNLGSSMLMPRDLSFVDNYRKVAR